MTNWKNLDTLDSYKALKDCKGSVDLTTVMAGESGADRAKNYSVPMAEKLTYNFAAKEVDDTVLEKLAALAKEAELVDKFQELYNGAVINTGENRLVLHQMTRGQLGEPVKADGVDKRTFYVEQQNLLLFPLHWSNMNVIELFTPSQIFRQSSYWSKHCKNHTFTPIR